MGCSTTIENLHVVDTSRYEFDEFVYRRIIIQNMNKTHFPVSWFLAVIGCMLHFGSSDAHASSQSVLLLCFLADSIDHFASFRISYVQKKTVHDPVQCCLYKRRPPLAFSCLGYLPSRTCFLSKSCQAYSSDQ